MPSRQPYANRTIRHLEFGGRTFSSNVTRPDSLKLARVFRAIRWREPGYLLARRCINLSRARLFPVLAGPLKRPSGARESKAVKAATIGWYGRLSGDASTLPDAITMAIRIEKKKDIAAAAALIYENQSHGERFDVNINRLVISL